MMTPTITPTRIRTTTATLTIGEGIGVQAVITGVAVTGCTVVLTVMEVPMVTVARMEATPMVVLMEEAMAAVVTAEAVDTTEDVQAVEIPIFQTGASTLRL